MAEETMNHVTVNGKSDRKDKERMERCFLV